MFAALGKPGRHYSLYLPLSERQLDSNLQFILDNIGSTHLPPWRSFPLSSCFSSGHTASSSLLHLSFATAAITVGKHFLNPGGTQLIKPGSSVFMVGRALWESNRNAWMEEWENRERIKEQRKERRGREQRTERRTEGRKEGEPGKMPGSGLDACLAIFCHERQERMRECPALDFLPCLFAPLLWILEAWNVTARKDFIGL